MSVTVHFDKVVKAYGDKTILGGIDLTVNAGEFVAVAARTQGIAAGDVDSVAGWALHQVDLDAQRSQGERGAHPGQAPAQHQHAPGLRRLGEDVQQVAAELHVAPPAVECLRLALGLSA